MTNRKGKFKIKNGSGSYDQVMLETQLGQVVDSPIKSVERSTRYEQNDVVAEQTCKGTFFVCTTAGTTAASAPSGYSSVSEGGSVTDGTAVFTAHRFNNLANTAAITAHNSLETAHPNLDFVTQLNAAADGLHYRTRNGKSDQVIDLINRLQATLSQETVPSGNTGTLAALLSGIVHQLKALSGKSNWWDTPKNNFETLSSGGVVAGNVSNANAWWVKLGGAVPLIIQGGSIANYSSATYPIALSRVLWITRFCGQIKPNSSNGFEDKDAGYRYTNTGITIYRNDSLWIVVGIA